MRVLHVDTGREWRGGQVQLLRLVRDAGSEHAVVLPPDAPLRARLEAAGVAVFPVDFRGRWRGGAALGRVAREFRPDVLAAHTAHAHHWADRVGGAAVVVHRRVDFAPRSPGRYPRAAGTIAVSDAVARVLVGAGAPPDRIVVVPDGVEIPPGDADRAGVRAGLGLPPDAPLVVAVGALVAHKGHAAAIDALPALPGVHLVLLGEGPLAGALARRARRLGVGDRLHLPGWQPAVGRWLRSADAVCHPSLEEGLGQGVIEALLTGAPLVVSRAGGVPEIVGDQIATHPPGDPEALARALRSVLADPAAARDRSVTRAAAVAERFSVARMVADTRAAWARFAG